MLDDRGRRRPVVFFKRLMRAERSGNLRRVGISFRNHLKRLRAQKSCWRGLFSDAERRISKSKDSVTERGEIPSFDSAFRSRRFSPPPSSLQGSGRSGESIEF